jgi:hypothetical protein
LPIHRLAFALAAATFLFWAVAMGLSLRAAALPDDASGMIVAVFAPGTEAPEAFARVLAAGGTPVRPTDPGLGLVAFAEAPGFAGRLREQGALLVLGDFPFGPVLAGCSGLGAPLGG